MSNPNEAHDDIRSPDKTKIPTTPNSKSRKTYISTFHGMVPVHETPPLPSVALSSSPSLEVKPEIPVKPQPVEPSVESNDKGKRKRSIFPGKWGMTSLINLYSTQMKDKDRHKLHRQTFSGDVPSKDEIDKAEPRRSTSDIIPSFARQREQYMLECDRRTRGSKKERANNVNVPLEDMHISRNEEKSAPRSLVGPTTPLNTSTTKSREKIGLSRGLGVIPLLCAAASESRSAYLARLQSTNLSNGWWSNKGLVCFEPGNPLSFVEKLIIGLAKQVETISLLANNYVGEETSLSAISPCVVQSFLWPFNKILLEVWILWILICTYLGSLVTISQTLLFGAKHTKNPLGGVFLRDIRLIARAVDLLCEQHQAIGVRLTGLMLIPLMMICNLSNLVVGQHGILQGSILYVALGLCTWWYWICVVPWLAAGAMSVAVMSGWCFGLIEFSRT